MKKNKKGFTLIELLAVIVILAILVGLIVTAVVQSSAVTVSVLVLLAGFLHHQLRHFHFVRLLSVNVCIEIPPLPVKRFYENEGHIGFYGLNGLDEGEESLLNQFRRWVGEGIEDVGIHIGSGGKSLSEIGLEQTVAGASQIQQLQTAHTRELGGPAHTGAGASEAVGEGRAEYCDAVFEGGFGLLYGGT